LTSPHVKEGEIENFLYFAESCSEGCLLKIVPINEIFKRAALSFNVKKNFV
jgi:hypothetical protein